MYIYIYTRICYILYMYMLHIYNINIYIQYKCIYNIYYIYINKISILTATMFSFN